MPTYNFSSVPSNISVGDNLYYSNNGSPVLIGEITAVSNTYVTVASASSTPPTGAFLFVGKNGTAESFGLKGYYANVRLTTTDLDNAEIFASNIEVSKSFP